MQRLKCRLTLNGRTPSKQVIPTQVQIHNRFISGNVHRALKPAGDTIVLKDSFFISGRVSLNLLCPLSHIVEVLYADPAIVVMDAGHDVITTLAEKKVGKRGGKNFSLRNIHIYPIASVIRNITKIILNTVKNP